MYKALTKGALPCVATAILVSGCGGGGSDSGGGSDGVKFRGPEQTSLSLRGRPLRNTGRVRLRATVSDKNIVLTDVDNHVFSGVIQLNGSFVAKGSFFLGNVAPGIRCGEITVTYLGTVADNEINGSSEGSTVCDTDTGDNVSTIRRSTFSISPQG